MNSLASPCDSRSGFRNFSVCVVRGVFVAKDAVRAFYQGLMRRNLSPARDDRNCAQPDKALRKPPDEKQLDKMIEDSFPASDPPGTY